MADWYVYQHDGDPIGPWSTDAVANAILAGKLAPDVWVAAPGGARWLRALDVPVIGRLVEGIPTRPGVRDSGLRIMPGAFSTEGGTGLPAFGSTMMIVKDDEIDVADVEVGSVSRMEPKAESEDLVDSNEPPTKRTSAPPALAAAEVHDTHETPMRSPLEFLPPPPSSTPTPPLPPGGVRVEHLEPRRRKNG